MVKTYTVTNVGQVRNRNEDTVFSEELDSVGWHVLGVADGMGGHERGDIASEIAATGVPDLLDDVSEEEDLEKVLNDVVQGVNQRVISESGDGGNGMGTTLVFGVIRGNEAKIANVGDSRAYLVDGGAKQITADHSLVQQLVEQGTITEEEAENHPQRNVVSQALGTYDEVEPDFYDVSLEDGVLLFCSDGLTEEVSDDTIAETVEEASSLEEAGDAVVERANENGGSDNVSVALARVN